MWSREGLSGRVIVGTGDTPDLTRSRLLLAEIASVPSRRGGRRSTRSPTAPALTGAMNSAPEWQHPSPDPEAATGRVTRWATHPPLLPQDGLLDGIAAWHRHRPATWRSGPRDLSPPSRQRPGAPPDEVFCSAPRRTRQRNRGFYRSVRAIKGCCFAEPGPLLLMTWAGTPGPCTDPCAIGTVDQPSLLQGKQQPAEARGRVPIGYLLGRRLGELATRDGEATGVLGYVPRNECIQVVDRLVPRITGADNTSYQGRTAGFDPFKAPQQREVRGQGLTPVHRSRRRAEAAIVKAPDDLAGCSHLAGGQIMVQSPSTFKACPLMLRPEGDKHDDHGCY